VDERICQTLIDEEISLGDFILSGGEVPAMAVIEAVARLLPGFLGAATSVNEETFSDGLLEYPQYTRPDSFRGLDVPEVLLSGNHGAINTWRRRMRLRRTYERRPGLLAEAKLTDTDRKFLAKLDSEQGSGAGSKKS
jgi:tRNA (guanine37-N1)-methyltransferase